MYTSPFDLVLHVTQFLRVKKHVLDSSPVLGHFSLCLFLVEFLHMISSDAHVVYVPVSDSEVVSQVALNWKANSSQALML